MYSKNVMYSKNGLGLRFLQPMVSYVIEPAGSLLHYLDIVFTSGGHGSRHRPPHIKNVFALSVLSSQKSASTLQPGWLTINLDRIFNCAMLAQSLFS
jgi:hypothetical protein